MNTFKNLKVMGRAFVAVAVFAIGAIGSGCVEADPPSLSVAPQIYRIGAEGGTLDLRVMTNTQWEAVNVPDWMELSRTGGHGSQNLEVYIDEYRGGSSEGRQGTVTFRISGSHGDVATLTVKQRADSDDAVIDVQPTEYTIGAEGGDVNFAVLASVDWTVQPIGVEAPWVTCTPVEGSGDGVITMTVAPNENHATDRQAHFLLSTTSTSLAEGEKRYETIVLTQSKLPTPQLALTQSDIAFPATVPAAMLPHNVPILTNVSLAPPVVISAPAWLQADVVENSGTYGVRITSVENNDKQCITITFLLATKK